jgi:hypothetical protein
MTYFKSALTAALLAFALPAVGHANDNPVVVELYTSQGCSSCPAADALMHELSKRDDVIALALHVDYWDYIGWKDPFGDPAHAVRQRAYATEGSRRSIFTPEMIVHGQTDIIGAKPMVLSKAIAEHAARSPSVDVDVLREGDTLRIDANVLTEASGPMTIYMLRYTPKKTTEIKRGENAGKTLHYANVVEAWTALGTWDGREAMSIETQIIGHKPVVIIVQSRVAGPIIAAAVLR